MTKFYTVGNVNHDNKAFGPGEAIELSDKDAAPLLAVKAIESEAAHEVRVAEADLAAKRAALGGEAPAAPAPVTSAAKADEAATAAGTTEKVKSDEDEDEDEDDDADL